MFLGKYCSIETMHTNRNVTLVVVHTESCFAVDTKVVLTVSEG